MGTWLATSWSTTAGERLSFPLEEPARSARRGSAGSRSQFSADISMGEAMISESPMDLSTYLNARMLSTDASRTTKIIRMHNSFEHHNPQGLNRFLCGGHGTLIVAHMHQSAFRRILRPGKCGISTSRAKSGMSPGRTMENMVSAQGFEPWTY